MALLYRHIRLDTNQPFYIGVAKKKSRPFSKNGRNKVWKEIVSKTNKVVVVPMNTEYGSFNIGLYLKPED